MRAGVEPEIRAYRGRPLIHSAHGPSVGSGQQAPVGGQVLAADGEVSDEAVLAVGAFCRGIADVEHGRGDVLALREKEFVEAARALGHGWLRIITRHILPHTLPAVLVIGSFYMAIAILAEAALSYIGLGVQPPAPSLGQMLVDGRQFMQQSHWVATIPGLAILLMVVGFNLLGDGLRDVLDPQLKEF